MTTNEQKPEPVKRRGRGLIVVIILAVIFFTLLTLIVLRSDDKPAGPTAPSETLTVLPLRIRIRTEPHAKAPVVATASNGEHLTMLEDRGAWVRVQTSDGLAGWAERANLERTAEQQRRMKRFQAIRSLPPLQGSVTEKTQLFAGPGIFYPLVGELPAGRKVTVYTRDHDFFAVQQGDGVAYADVDAIDITASGSSQLNVQTSSAPEVIETETAAPTATETAVAEAPEAPPEPPPSFEPPPSIERAGGVYSTVPAGGTQPQEIRRIVPRYPGAARRAGVQGSVVIRGIVRRDGSIDDLEIIKDLPYGLGDEAVRAVSRWTFRPAMYRGEPIDVYYTVTVNFRLQ